MKTYPNFNFKKQLGQNFLYDEESLLQIINFANIEPSQSIFEIGPGDGNLTKFLLSVSKNVICIEIDKTLIPVLSKKFSSNSNFFLINGDFLKMSDDFIYKFLSDNNLPNNNLKVVANIPYYITSPIIMKLLSSDLFQELNILVQKEVADRILAVPHTKDYGVLTLGVKFYSDVFSGPFISKEKFTPTPKVDSQVVKFIKKQSILYNIENEFFTLVKASFAQRRKTILNSLSSSLKIEKNKVFNILSSLNIDPLNRPEDLSFEDFLLLSNNYSNFSS